MRISMSLLSIAFFLGLGLVACTSGEGSPAPDAGTSPGDGPQPTADGPQPDGPAGAVCTGAAYDPCTTNTQCLSNNCKEFSQQQIQVCTQTCNAQTPCPMQNGQAVPCNNMGLCRPVAASTCTRP